MKTKWIVLAVVTAATLTSGCMAFKEIFGHSRTSSSSSSGDDGVLAESELTTVDDAASRSEAAANRAAAIADRASVEAERTESGFHKSLHK